MMHNSRLDAMSASMRTGAVHCCLPTHGVTCDANSKREVCIFENSVACSAKFLSPIDDLQLLFIHRGKAWRIKGQASSPCAASVARLVCSDNVTISSHSAQKRVVVPGKSCPTCCIAVGIADEWELLPSTADWKPHLDLLTCGVHAFS